MTKSSSGTQSVQHFLVNLLHFGAKRGQKKRILNTAVVLSGIFISSLGNFLGYLS